MKFLRSIKEYKSALIAVIIIALIAFYSNYRSNKVKDHGVITVCRVNGYEPLSDGSNTYLTIFINGKKYEAISGMGLKKLVGKFLFVRVLRSDPTYETFIYKNQEVPPCILKDGFPIEGWNEIPTCK